MKLLATLTAALGPSQAALELKWLQRQSKTPTELANLVARRAAGSQPFGPLNLLSRPPVLIPRPETEHWVIKLADQISGKPHSDPKHLLDLGTGSGCIPLLLCHLLPQGSLHTRGVDISEHALRLATDNAKLCGTPPPSEANIPHNTFTAIKANFLSPSFSDDAAINPPYDIVTSNPPYIPWDEYLELHRSVSAYEDPKALFGGPDGLTFYHAIASLVSRKGFLRPGALVALEVGHEQAQDVEQIMRVEAHMHDVEVWSDPWGKKRTVLAHM